MSCKKLGTAELSVLVAKNDLESLPTTTRGIQYRANKEKWGYEEVSTQGGKHGLKKIYTLPHYLIEELRAKGLLHLLETPSSPTHATNSTNNGSLMDDCFPLFWAEAFHQYMQWASEQNRNQAIPIRYYNQVFASAGTGRIVWDNNCDVMWFRESFIKRLAINPTYCFCTRIQGDSMFPTLIDRGTVLWQATARFIGEGVYLFRYYNEIRVKRLIRTGIECYQIISDNPNKSIYPTLELDLSHCEPDEFELYGRYIWSGGIAA